MIQTRGYSRGAPVGSGTMTRKGGDFRKPFKVIDISATGARFLAGEGFQPGDAIEVQLEITDVLFEKSISFEGKILKKEADNEGIAYVIKITKMDMEDQVEIDEMIKSLNLFSMNFSEGLMSSSDVDFGINWLEGMSQGDKDKDKDK